MPQSVSVYSNFVIRLKRSTVLNFNHMIIKYTLAINYLWIYVEVLDSLGSRQPSKLLYISYIYTNDGGY